MYRSAFFATLTALIALPVAVQAQGDGPPGGFQPPPEMMKKIQAWEQWRQTHKNVSALQQTISGLSEMDQDPKTKLTRPQAQKILPLLKKWSVPSALTDAQARQINQQLTTVLALPQIKKIASIRTGPGEGPGSGPGNGPGGGGPPPGMGGAMAGGPPPGGAQPAFDPARFPEPKDFNPLKPGTLPFEPMRVRARQNMETLMRNLQSRAL